MNNAIDEEAVREALETGQLLTANQAAHAVGVTVGTFNYHRRQGRIPHISTPAGVSYVYLSDAIAFKEKLAAWRTARNFTAFSKEFFEDQDEESAHDGRPNGRPSVPSSTCA